MAKTRRYPLRLRLERFAISKNIKLKEMSPEQVRSSKIKLDEYLQGGFDKLNREDENPVILI